MRRAVDQIRYCLFGRGSTDPVSSAEQFSFLFFAFLVKGIDADNQAGARFFEKPYNSLFDSDWELRNPLNASSCLTAPDVRGGRASVLGTTATIARKRLRWSIWANGGRCAARTPAVIVSLVNLRTLQHRGDSTTLGALIAIEVQRLPNVRKSWNGTASLPANLRVNPFGLRST